MERNHQKMIPDDAREATDGACGLLTEKIRLFRIFLALSESLREALKQDDAEQAATLILRRQQQMDGIDRVDGWLSKLKKKDRKGWKVPAGMEQRFQRLLGELVEVIQKVAPVNEDCGALALSRVAELRNNLADIRNGRQGLQGYHGRAAQISRFLDTRT